MTSTPAEFSVAAVESAVESALLDFEVYDIGSYGWLNESDADPDMLGHAIWQTEQPTVDHRVIFEDLPVQRRPADTEKHVLALGEDFCGLMKASRLSLGLALVWLPEAKKNILNEPSFFWLHHMDAFVKLSIAADRLRDLLVVACTADAPETYKNKSRQNRLYATPFEESASLLATRGITDNRLTAQLAALRMQGLKIFAYIDRRNLIVHKLSTRMATFLRDEMVRQQSQYDREQIAGFQPKTKNADWRTQAEPRTLELERELDTAIAGIKDWYLLLIAASNNVFQVEYRSRAHLDAATDA